MTDEESHLIDNQGRALTQLISRHEQLKKAMGHPKDNSREISRLISDAGKYAKDFIICLDVLEVEIASGIIFPKD